MADKNWLIRTKNNQILGPATKQKVIELIQKGSLTGEDEICSGNGYWIWIKEDELLEKYVFGDMVQDFNPISEAPDVLTAGGRNVALDPFLASSGPVSQKETAQAANPASSTKSSNNNSKDKEEVLLPASEDLEYPDLDMMSDIVAEDIIESQTSDVDLDVDLVDIDGLENDDIEIDTEIDLEEDATRLDLSDLSGQIAEMKAHGQGQLNEADQELLPSDDDLEYPNLSSASHIDDESEENVNPLKDDTQEIILEAPKTKPDILAKKKIPSKPQKIRSPRKSSFNVDEKEEDLLNINEDDEIDSHLSQRKPRNDKYLFFILILVVFLIAVLYYYYRMILNKPLPLVGISSAHAQSISTLSKKKTSSNYII